jgi:acetyl-CoA acetyltransferase
LHRASDIQLSQVDRVEINEAFAAQFLACAKESCPTPIHTK